MKELLFATGVTLILISPVNATGKCNGEWKTRTGPTGITMQLYFDDKYSTCMRDAVRIGWTSPQAHAYCDKRLADGRLK